MRRKIVVVVILLLFLLGGSTPVAAEAPMIKTGEGDGTWYGRLWVVKLYPGEAKSTSISLYNPSSGALVVLVTLTPSSFDGGNLVFGLDGSTLTLFSKESTTITLTASASRSTKPGKYTTQLEVKFKSAWDFSNTPEEVEEVEVVEEVEEIVEEDVPIVIDGVVGNNFEEVSLVYSEPLVVPAASKLEVPWKWIGASFCGLVVLFGFYLWVNQGRKKGKKPVKVKREEIVE